MHCLTLPKYFFIHSSLASHVPFTWPITNYESPWTRTEFTPSDLANSKPWIRFHIRLHYWLSGTIDEWRTSDDPLLVIVKLSQFLIHAVWTNHLYGQSTALPPDLYSVDCWQRSKFSNEVCEDLSFNFFCWSIFHIKFTKFHCPLDQSFGGLQFIHSFFQQVIC